MVRTASDADRVLAACPDAEWRLLFALSRYPLVVAEGIRPFVGPSEAERVRLDPAEPDLDWTAKQLSIWPTLLFTVFRLFQCSFAFHGHVSMC